MGIDEQELKEFQSLVWLAEQEKNTAFFEKYLDKDAVIKLRTSPDTQIRTVTRESYLKLLALDASEQNDDETIFDEVMQFRYDEQEKTSEAYTRCSYCGLWDEEVALRVTSHNFLKCKKINDRIKIIAITDAVETVEEMQFVEVRLHS